MILRSSGFRSIKPGFGYNCRMESTMRRVFSLFNLLWRQAQLCDAWFSVQLVSQEQWEWRHTKPSNGSDWTERWTTWSIEEPLGLNLKLFFFFFFINKRQTYPGDNYTKERLVELDRTWDIVNLSRRGVVDQKMFGVVTMPNVYNCCSI